MKIVGIVCRIIKDISPLCVEGQIECFDVDVKEPLLIEVQSAVKAKLLEKTGEILICDDDFKIINEDEVFEQLAEQEEKLGKVLDNLDWMRYSNECP